MDGIAVVIIGILGLLLAVIALWHIIDSRSSAFAKFVQCIFVVGVPLIGPLMYFFLALLPEPKPVQMQSEERAPGDYIVDATLVPVIENRTWRRFMQRQPKKKGDSRKKYTTAAKQDQFPVSLTQRIANLYPYVQIAVLLTCWTLVLLVWTDANSWGYQNAYGMFVGKWLLLFVTVAGTIVGFIRIIREIQARREKLGRPIQK